jgi:hypothetical protein
MATIVFFPIGFGGRLFFPASLPVCFLSCARFSSAFIFYLLNIGFRNRNEAAGKEEDCRHSRQDRPKKEAGVQQSCRPDCEAQTEQTADA